jgi:hypothetical protein
VITTFTSQPTTGLFNSENADFAVAVFLSVHQFISYSTDGRFHFHRYFISFFIALFLSY